MNPTARYWIPTAILLFGLVGGGLADLTGAATPQLTAMGYPDYLGHILGVAKLSGAAVIALPGLPRLKEWAHAGVVINMLGAAWSHVASDGAANAVAPLVVLAISLASWALRPEGRRLVG